jgi:hypothetical protein
MASERLCRGFASAAEAHFGIQAKEKTEHRLGAVLSLLEITCAC